MSLESFFSAMPPMLLGRTSVEETLDELGSSPSGPQSVEYYRVLVERNWRKYMREIFPFCHKLLVRDDPKLWETLVADYFEAHPPRTRHANELGADFSEYLQLRRTEGLAISPVLEELAEYHMCEVRCMLCPDGVGDGFERRLFVRQFSFPIPAVISTVRADPGAALPEPETITLILYRDLETLETRQVSPTPFGLVALARRQGLPIPEALQGRVDIVDQAERELVELRVLTPQ
jgi:hypothetical protein